MSVASKHRSQLIPVVRFSRNFLSFVKLDGSLPCPQQTGTEPYPGSHKSSTHPSTPFPQHIF